MFRRLAVSSLILALILAGCSTPAAPATPTAQPTATAVTAAPVGPGGIPGIVQKGDTVTITGSQGEKVTVSGNMPAELANFPVPPGFTYDSGGSMAAQGKDGSTMSVATWKGKSTVEAVLAHFKQLAPQQGWKETMSFSDAKSGQLWYEGANDMSYILTATAQDGGIVEVAVLAGKAPKATPVAAQPPAAPGALQSPVSVATIRPQATQPAMSVASLSQLPAELRDNVPIPGGFALQADSVMRLDTGGKFATATATLEGTGTPDSVVQFYRQNLPGKGWKEDSALNTPDGSQLTFSMDKAGAEYMLLINVGREDPNTIVTLMLYGS